jgi:hypothetical protein
MCARRRRRSHVPFLGSCRRHRAVPAAGIPLFACLDRFSLFGFLRGRSSPAVGMRAFTPGSPLGIPRARRFPVAGSRAFFKTHPGSQRALLFMELWLRCSVLRAKARLGLFRQVVLESPTWVRPVRLCDRGDLLRLATVASHIVDHTFKRVKTNGSPVSQALGTEVPDFRHNESRRTAGEPPKARRRPY